MEPSKELSRTAYGRINATINAYCSDNIEWLEIFDNKTYHLLILNMVAVVMNTIEIINYMGTEMTLRYASNLPHWKQLKVVLPHGINSSKVVWSKSILANLPVACYSDHKIDVYRKLFLKFGLEPKLFKSSSVSPII